MSSKNLYLLIWNRELFVYVLRVQQTISQCQAERPDAESKLSAQEESISSPVESSRGFSALARNSNFPGVNISVEEDGDCDDDFSTLRLVVFVTVTDEYNFNGY